MSTMMRWGCGVSLLLIAAVPQAFAQLDLVESGYLSRSAGADEENDRYGESLVLLDINGDGANEVAVGQPNWDGVPGSSAGLIANRGRVHLDFAFTVIPAERGGPVYLEECLDVAVDEEATGVGYQFGAALAAGDFNGDGFDDLAIGIPGAERDGDEEGAVCVVYGADSQNPSAFTQQRVRKPVTANRENGDPPAFGATLLVADLNLDGYADLLIGAPGADRPEFVEVVTDAGAALLLYGGPFGLFAGPEQLLSVSPLNPPPTSEQFGVSFAVGDFLVGEGERGVSYPDLLVGARTRTGEGRLWGYTGLSDGGLSVYPSLLDDWDLIGTRNEGDEFARSLATGDFNRDGHDDLAIGIPGDNDLGLATQAGAVMVLYGPAATIDQGEQLIFEAVLDGHNGGVTAFDRFGEVLEVGDFNVDGADDLAIGTPLDNSLGVGNAGEVTVLYGGDFGFSTAAVQVWNGIFFENGLEAGDEFGTALAAGPYGRGSLADDLVVGVPHKTLDGEAPNAGYSLLIRSSTLFGDGFESGGFGAWSSFSP